MMTSLRWQCMVCGYVHEGASPPEKCPTCGAPLTAFERIADTEAALPQVVNPRPEGFRYVIIGNSSAGRSAAQAILRLDPGARVTIVSEETHGFYYRPILPDYIGGLPEERVFAATGRGGNAGINLIQGETVSAVDASARVLRCDSGEAISYDSLLIASGSQPVMVPWPGSNARGIAYFRTFADAKALASMAGSAKRAVVVGGGLLGLEFVRAFLARGMEVTMLVREDRVGAPGLDKQAGAIVEKRARELGVELALQEEVASFESEQGRVKAVATSKGRTIDCDVVGVAVGVKPRIDFLAGSGVSVERGVIVDDRFETSVPGVFAAGDVAQVHDLASGASRVVTSWRNSKDQGEIAGFNMAGAEVRCAGVVGANFQTFGGIAFASIGLANPADGEAEIEADFDEANGTYRKLVRRDGVLLGAVLVGDTTAAGELERTIRAGLAGRD